MNEEQRIPSLSDGLTPVAADCYPELVARIAELEAKAAERSRVVDRDTASTARIAELEREVKHLEACVDNKDHALVRAVSVLDEHDDASAARIAELEREVTELDRWRHAAEVGAQRIAELESTIGELATATESFAQANGKVAAQLPADDHFAHFVAGVAKGMQAIAADLRVRAMPRRVAVGDRATGPHGPCVVGDGLDPLVRYHVDGDRIAELEAALRVAADRESDALDDRDAAWSRTAELQYEVEALRSALVEPPVEWVDGRATVGGFVLHAEQNDSDAGIEHFAIDVCAPEDDDNEETVVASIWHADEDTAKRGAIAVARAMGGGDGDV